MAEQPENVSLLDFSKTQAEQVQSTSSSTTNNSRRKNIKHIHEGEDINIIEDINEYITNKSSSSSSSSTTTTILNSQIQTMMNNKTTTSIFGDLYEKMKKSDTVPYGLAGIFSGLCTATATQPLDCAKTRIQVFKRLNMELPIVTGSSSSSAGIYQKFMNSKSIAMLSSIYKNEGWKALYRGLPPSLLSSCVSMSIFFPIYEICRKRFAESFGGEMWHTKVIVPAVLSAWAFSSVLVSPISLVKVRLQTSSTISLYSESNPSTTFLQVIKSIYKNEGLAGFYAGYRGVAISATVFCLYFSVYEPLKLYCVNTLNLPYLAVVPILSPLTMIAVSTLTYPNDLIISNLQFQGKKNVGSGSGGGGVHYNGWIDAFKSIYKSGGVKALYSGLNTYLLRFCLGTIVTQTSYETILRLMEKR